MSTTAAARRSTRRGPLVLAIAALATVVILVVVGIASTADGSSRTPDLVGRTFVSTDTPGHDLVAGTEVRLAFDEGHVSARAGCNTLFGGATWTDGVLEAPQLASTMMACSPDRMAQDAWLGDLLASGPALTLDGATLTIGDADNGLVLVETEA
ncbi:META domain-containing protein [Actinotalea solisilvae]|uniref:META domain-containing protein n=1 Tax=Actinotalea solisilvae TaxID=2072922 RepID=UPI0018F143C2|nr:META domain-containing protein [Actinotalea solisilvae]